MPPRKKTEPVIEETADLAPPDISSESAEESAQVTVARDTPEDELLREDPLSALSADVERLRGLLEQSLEENRRIRERLDDLERIVTAPAGAVQFTEFPPVDESDFVDDEDDVPDFVPGVQRAFDRKRDGVGWYQP